MGIDSYMIPITISICLIAIAPIIAPDWGDIEEWNTPKIFPNAAISMNDDEYFTQLDNNIKKSTDNWQKIMNQTQNPVRDLMAEHEKNNP